MRKFLSVLILAALLPLAKVSQLNAQDDVQALTAKGHELSRNYLRPSLSFVYVTDGSAISDKFANGFESVRTDQVNINPLDNSRITLSFNSETSLDSIKSQLDYYIKSNRVGNQIMKDWFPNFDSKENGYSISVLEERGMYAAKDNDVISANASARSLNTVLSDLGEKLIDRSYVMFYVFRSKGDKKDMVKVNAFLYKLNFNSDVQSIFYEKYFNKPNGIDQCDFPVDFVAYTEPNMVRSLFGVGTYREKSIDDAYTHTNSMIASVVADLEVKETIAAVDPIRAKIGRKEGLKTDDRFFVMENVQGDDGQVKAVRVGAVRVGMNVADNRFNASDSISIGDEKKMSQFYQFCGGRIEEGQTLVYNPDLGIQFVATAGLSSVDLGVQYRASSLLSGFFKGKSLPGLFMYANIGLPFGHTKDNHLKFPASVKIDENTDMYFYSMTLGIGKEFNFFRFLSASVYAGYGTIGYTKPKDAGENFKIILDNGKEFNAGYLDTQARFGVNMGPNFNLFLFGGYRYIIDSASSSFVSDGLGIKSYNLGLGASFTI